MLILSRKWEERIVIRTPEGREVWITLIVGNNFRKGARLGIDAPRDWNIAREELDMARRGGIASPRGHDGDPAGDEVPGAAPGKPGEPG